MHVFRRGNESIRCHRGSRARLTYAQDIGEEVCFSLKGRIVPEGHILIAEPDDFGE